jgi:hypothetical protein
LLLPPNFAKTRLKKIITFFFFEKMAVHAPRSKERFLLQICSLKNLGQKRTTKDRVSSCAFVPYICYDKKTEFLSCFCLIYVLRQKDRTKERVLSHTFGTTKRPKKSLCFVPEFFVMLLFHTFVMTKIPYKRKYFILYI